MGLQEITRITSGSELHACCTYGGGGPNGFVGEGGGGDPDGFR